VKTRGLVMEVKKNACIVLTPQGEFREIAPAPKGIRPGEEIAFEQAGPVAASWWKIALAAACLLLFVWTGFLFYGNTQAVAYVGLDINPSLELGVNRQMVVCQARGLNGEGEDLLAGAAVRGLPLSEALRVLVEKAVAARYIVPGQENVILTTVTPVKGGGKQPLPDESRLSRAIEESLQAAGAEAAVIVEEAPPDLRKQAQERGLSAGRYLLQLNAERKGLQMDIEELKKKSLATLEKEKHFKVQELLRGAEKKTERQPEKPAAGGEAAGGEAKKAEPARRAEQRGGPPQAQESPSQPGQGEKENGSLRSGQGREGGQNPAAGAGQRGQGVQRGEGRSGEKGTGAGKENGRKDGKEGG